MKYDYELYPSGYKKGKKPLVLNLTQRQFFLMLLWWEDVIITGYRS
jgi:hypothetical protein